MIRGNKALIAACVSSAVGWWFGRRSQRRTELEWLRQELTATSDALITAERERGDTERAQRELVSAISHELRTPLAAIRAAAEAVQDGVAKETDRYLEALVSGVQRLNRVAGDLFELARVQSADVPASPVRLTDLLDSALAAALPVALERGVRLHGVGLDTVTDSVRVNVPVLTRALTNLVAHAVRHTMAGGQVTVTAAASGGELEVIVVEGCGGFADSKLENQLAPGEMGMAITTGLIRALGGVVRSDHESDGFRFLARLPVER